MAKRKIPSSLQNAAEQIHSTNRPRSVGVRTFLSWFGVKRRGYHVVRDIRYFLKRAKLITEPDFEIANIEGRVKLRPILTTKRLKEDIVQEVIELSIKTTSPEIQVTLSDPTPRLGTLDPANRKPLAVNRDAKVREAVTLMVQHDYSQFLQFGLDGGIASGFDAPFNCR